MSAWDQAKIAVQRMHDALTAAGWRLVSVYDGEEDEYVNDVDKALEIVGDCDWSRMTYSNGTVEHWVLIIPENGADAVSDYSYAPVSDNDNFDIIMEKLA